MVISNSQIVHARYLPADQRPALVYLVGTSAGSQRTLRQSLNTIASFLSGGKADMESLDGGAIRYQHSKLVLAYLKQNYSPATTNKMLSAYRSVLHESHRLGFIGADDFAKAVDVSNIRYQRSLRGRALTTHELSLLIRSIQKDITPLGLRDAAMLAVLRFCGVRCAELVGLTIGDYSWRDGSLHVRGGKGDKDRYVYIPAEPFADYIQPWMEYRGNQSGALFCPFNKGHKMQLKHLTTTSVRDILIKRGTQAGIDSFTPHDLRRTFASDLLEVVDTITVQKLMGHADPKTTSLYDRRGEAAKQRAVNHLKL